MFLLMCCFPASKLSFATDAVKVMKRIFVSNGQWVAIYMFFQIRSRAKKKNRKCAMFLLPDSTATETIAQPAPLARRRGGRGSWPAVVRQSWHEQAANGGWLLHRMPPSPSVSRIKQNVRSVTHFSQWSSVTLLQVIAAEGEQKASVALKEAADIIGASPAALQLRYLQTLNSISAEKNSTIIFPVPIELMTGFIKK